MKLSRIISRFFHKDKFCYPKDFYWINKDSIKEHWNNNKILSVVALIIYFVLATLAFVGYYLLLPLRLLHELCEEWCYN